MAKITYIDSAGTARTIDAELGSTVMETAIKNDVPGIEAECGGACACATCHVYVDPEWVGRLAPPSDEEIDMLDGAFFGEPN
jgi:2Fe-2S ferredoxin